MEKKRSAYNDGHRKIRNIGNASETSKKELQEFVEQLNTKQFRVIEGFFDTMPKLSHKITVKNPNTSVESDVILEGLAAFFS